MVRDGAAALVDQVLTAVVAVRLIQPVAALPVAAAVMAAALVATVLHQV